VEGNETPSPSAQEPLAFTCSQVPPWAEGVSYHAKDKVKYLGRRYECIQAHTALSVWPPDIVPALWKDTGKCKTNGGGGTGGSSGGTGGAAANPGSGGSAGAGSMAGAGGPDGSGGTSTFGSSASGSGGSGIEYAPYFYTWGWDNTAYPFTSLVDLRNKSGLDSVTLAFVLSDGGCAPTQDIQQHASDVAAFRSSGGKLKASFGGANGTYLESACGSATDLAAAIKAFISNTGIDDLDFDVEQWGAMTADVNARRSKALAAVQSATGAKVSFTLAAMPRDKWGTPGGLTAAGVDVVRSAVQAGVTVSHVNLMVMDCSAYYSDGQAMGALAISALADAHAQMQAIATGLSDADAWAMLGATPMLGHNDVASEVFTQDDARTLVEFARQKKLGLLSFWAIDRDQPGSGDLGLYSAVNHSTFEFHHIFETVRQ